MKRLLPALAVASMASLAAAAPASAEIFFQDTYLSVRNLWQDRQPGTTGNVNETAGNISYANAWTYGSNFVSLDFEDFSKNDGANQTGFAPGARVTSDSMEFYGVFRTALSLNAITHTKNFSFGPISDVSLEVGGDICTQDDQFASYKRMVVFGPKFDIAMPKGFWSISLHISHEWNTDAYLANNSTNYDPAPELETAWLYPFSVAGLPLKFTGFMNIVGPKGKGGTGDSYHQTEILAHPKLMVDVGALMGGKPGVFDAGVGYEYWLNKFGNPPNYQGQHLPGTQQNAFFIEAGYHF
jgi:hypothetical protein